MLATQQVYECFQTEPIFLCNHQRVILIEIQISFSAQVFLAKLLIFHLFSKLKFMFLSFGICSFGFAIMAISTNLSNSFILLQLYCSLIYSHELVSAAAMVSKSQGFCFLQTTDSLFVLFLSMVQVLKKILKFFTKHSKRVLVSKIIGLNFLTAASFCH